MLYKERTPETNLRGSQSGGYLSRTLSSYMYQNYVLVVNTRMCSALPKNLKLLGTPMGRRVDSIAHEKSPKLMLGALKVAATYSPTMQCSTIGDAELNDPVRNGKGWDLSAITTLIIV